ncbi:hypothetical protein LV779_34755 [Streptomyces thinghirensis]|nr:hypothetical protein [Streptomyces thinghirensis]
MLPFTIGVAVPSSKAPYALVDHDLMARFRFPAGAGGAPGRAPRRSSA